MDTRTIRHSIGIDVGASKVNIGVLDGAGNLLARSRVEIGDRNDSGGTIERICREAAEVTRRAGIPNEAIDFIGMGIPGTVEAATRRVLFAPNLGWSDVEVGELFRRDFGLEVELVQDARAAALAEYLLGAGKGEPVVICVTLGSGIGAGIIIDGRIYGGGFGTAGELGHSIVQADGLPCGCGRRGCLEAYASGTAIAKASARGPGGAEGAERAEAVFKKAEAGDPAAMDIVGTAARYLGIGIVNAVNLLSPNVVIFSGGMCEQEELFIRPVRDFVLKNAYSIAVAERAFRIVKAALGEDAPMIGAGLLYKGV
jgi:glucokinase